MDVSQLPEAVFDDSRAMRLFPKPAPKMAVLTLVPRTDDGKELPTFIKPRAGGVQVFYGNYYSLIDHEGVVRRGSAEAQWEAMHARVGPYHWVKIVTPQGYVADRRCRIVTLIPAENGDTVEEHNDEVNLGDWIVRQPGDELQYIRLPKYPSFYYSQAEAEALGLVDMTAEEFSTWAVERAHAMIE